MTRPLQHRDVAEPIERICRDFLNSVGVAAIYHGELTRQLIDHANDMVRLAQAEAYEAGKNDAIRQAAEG